jgi:hypothetical protein
VDVYRAIRVHAYADVVAGKPTHDYSLRSIFRWYSEKFHTPLHLVEDLPVYDVMQHYYEWHAEQLVSATDAESVAAFHDELKELSMTEAELKRHQAEQDRQAYEDHLFNEEVDAEALAVAAKIAAKTAKRAAEEIAAGPRVFSVPEAGMTASEPNISLAFGDEEPGPDAGMFGFKP